MNKFFDLDEIKKEVNLPLLMEHYGYENRPEKTSRNYIFMESPGRSLVVYKNRKSHWVYFDVHEDKKYFDPAGQNIKNSTTGKTVFDFLMMENGGMTFKEAMSQAYEIKKTKEYANDRNLLSDVKASEKVNPQKIRNIVDFQFKPLSAYSNAYFKSRGIDPDIIRDGLFKNIFSEWEVSFQRGSGKSNSVGSIMFTQEGERVCLLSSAEGRKTFALGARSASLWYTNPGIVKEGADIHFMAESWQDAVAHFEMNYDRLKGMKILYSSIQGNLTPDQVEFHKKLYKEKCKETVSIFDNDIQGLKYINRLYTAFDSTKPLNIDFLVHNKESMAEFFIKWNDDIRDLYRLVHSLENFTEINIRKADDKTDVATITLTWNSEEEGIHKLKKMAEFTHRVKELPRTLKAEFSKSKDFNQDLKSLKGLDKNIEI